MPSPHPYRPGYFVHDYEVSYRKQRPIEIARELARKHDGVRQVCVEREHEMGGWWIELRLKRLTKRDVL